MSIAITIIQFRSIRILIPCNYTDSKYAEGKYAKNLFRLIVKTSTKKRRLINYADSEYADGITAK